FLKSDRRLIAQEFLRPSDVSERVLDVARPLRTVLRRAAVTGQSLQQGIGLVQRNPPVAGRIESLPGDRVCGRMTCQKVPVDDILNECEVAALLAIPVNGRLLSRQHSGNED